LTLVGSSHDRWRDVRQGTAGRRGGSERPLAASWRKGPSSAGASSGSHGAAPQACPPVFGHVVSAARSSRYMQNSWSTGIVRRTAVDPSRPEDGNVPEEPDPM